jgi:von Willebrand factor A domain-containing protein 7
LHTHFNFAIDSPKRIIFNSFTIMLGVPLWKILFSVLILVLQVHAFFPVDWRENLVGNGGISHVKQTETVWKSVALNKYFPFLKGDFSLAMQAAMKTVADANADVDDNQHDSELHFDGENFIGGQVRLTNQRVKVIQALSQKDATTARKELGAALHTLQDFYAHRQVMF